MDPITAIGVASTAYSAIVKGFQVKKDITSMTKEIGTWMTAINDVKQGHEKVKKKKFGSIEEEALETFAAKKKAEKMEEELRNFLIFNYGLNAWNDVLKIQGQIRKERQLEMEAKRRRMTKIIEITIASFLLMLGFVGIVALVWWALWLKRL